jgi:hypothetical protein
MMDIPVFTAMVSQWPLEDLCVAEGIIVGLKVNARAQGPAAEPERKRKSPTCSNCGKPGHRAPTCPGTGQQPLLEKVEAGS